MKRLLYGGLGLLGAGFAGWAVAVGVLVAAQDHFVFPAPSVDVAALDARAVASGARPIRLTGAAGTPLYAWHRPAKGERGLLFCHGNGETVARVDLHDAANALGFDVIVVAYPGYPGSGGAPSEAGMWEAAQAGWTLLTDGLEIPADRVVVHGKSLGGGAAAMVAERLPVAGLVLESTFLSIPEVAADRMPWVPAGLLLRTRLESGKRAPKLTLPTLVLHADADPVIGVRHGRSLAERLPNATYVEVRGAMHSESLAVVDAGAAAAWARFLRRATP